MYIYIYIYIYIYTNLQLSEYIYIPTWVYILSCSLISLTLHIGLHITSTESFWHFCYRRPKFPFHKPSSHSLVTNIRLLTPYSNGSLFLHVVDPLQTLLFMCIACWNLTSSITCDTMVTFKSASARANQVDESTKRYKT